MHKLAFVLLIIGGLNWGLEALGTGLGHWISGAILTIIYALVGLAALYELFTHNKRCKHCNTKM
jgi:uncharacterized membrane protein YuzA (DUF378 family)